LQKTARIATRLLVLSEVVCVGALLAACNYNPFNAPGGGSQSQTVNLESRSVSGFSAVSLETSGDLTISVTGKASLTVEAEPSVLPLLTSDVSGNRLILSSKPNVSIQTSQPIRYTLTVKDLNDVVLDGSGNVTISGLAVSNFNATINGSGSIAIKGQADSLTVAVNGSGSFDDSNLTSNTVTVNDSGSGNVVVQASDTLNANVSGSGSVRYIGNPSVKSTVNGSGSVSKQ